jgi:N-acyl-D-aspartate/D-glutamate deacylase
MYDLVIRGGDVIDGTGAPRQRADVGITDGRVAAIGDVAGSSDSIVIDATGKVVAPGFVDVHTHLDVQGFWDPTLSPSPLHGVTTVIGGNCGFSVAPLSPDSADYLMRMLARVEGMPLSALEIGVPWDWQTTGEFLDRLDGTLAINAGFMVGHSALRRVVMGDDAVRRTSTPDELAQMQDLLRDGLRAGGIGFSSTWSTTHNDADGVPVPSRWADAHEMVALAAVCGEFPGTSLEFLPGGSMALFPDECNDVMVEMTVAAQRPLNWNVAIVDHRGLDRCITQLSVADRARPRGGKIVGLTMPIMGPSRFNFLSGFALDAIPGWEDAMALRPDEKLAYLLDRSARSRLYDASQQPSPMRHMGNWARKIIVETHTAELKHYEGRLVGDIAAEEGKLPFDALLDIVCDDGLRTSFANIIPEASNDDWAARVQIWRDPRAVVGASDAGAHLDMTPFFTYATGMLGEAVRERQLITMEEAVHLLTDVPARLYGLVGRGRLEVGAHADVVVIDESCVGSEPIVTRFDLPGGAPRLYAAAYGIDHVVVGGVEIARHGEFTGARPGAILRSGTDTVTADMT